MPVLTAREMMMRRTALAVGLFVLLTAAVTVSPAVAQPTASSPSDVAADFNHDGAATRALQKSGVHGAERTQRTAQVFSFRFLPWSEQGLHGRAQLRDIERLLQKLQSTVRSAILDQLF